MWNNWYVGVKLYLCVLLSKPKLKEPEENNIIVTDHNEANECDAMTAPPIKYKGN